MTHPNFIEMTRRFEASPEEVYAAWTDPAVVARWLFTSPTSEEHEVAMDLRVGGAWKIRDRRDGVDYVAMGEFLELDPPRKVAMTFGMPQFSPEFGRLVIEIEPDGDGAIMTLTQLDLPYEMHEPTRQGWLLMFNGLVTALPPRQSVTVVRELSATPGEVYAAFTELEVMRTWMGRSVKAQVELGGRYAIETDTGDADRAMMVGQYWALVPGQRVLFTFYAGPGEDPEAGSPQIDQYVDIALEPLAGGRTRLTLTHAWGGRLHDAKGLRETQGGWNWWLDRLAGAL